MSKPSNKCNGVINTLKEKIAAGIFPVFSKIPSETQLCNMFDVSRVTIRKALESLKFEGLIESRQGSGYFVSANNIKNLIPVIMSSSSDAFRMSEIYQGIQDFFSNTKFNPLMLLSENNPNKERDLISEYYNNGFSNMLIIPYSSATNVGFYQSFMNSNVNFVFIDTKPDKLDCNYVASCNFTGGYLATKHLIDLGHRRICYCANDEIENANTLIQRLAGYKLALTDHGIKIDPNLIFSKKVISIKEHANECILRSPDATAYFCTSDAVALAISNLTSKKSRKVAIIGFDNLSFAETSTPSISSVDQNFYEIGRCSAELLYNHIIKHGKSFDNKFIPIKVIPRSTTLSNKLI